MPCQSKLPATTKSSHNKYLFSVEQLVKSFKNVRLFSINFGKILFYFLPTDSAFLIIYDQQISTYSLQLILSKVQR